MIYEAKEYTLKNGLNIIVKTPEISEAREVLNNIIEVSSKTNGLNSEPEDFKPFLEDITKEEEHIRNYRDGKNYMICVYLGEQIIGCCSLNFNKNKKSSHRGIVGIGIQKPYWDLGIGSLLFDILIDLAKNTNGIEQIELSVVKTNDRAKHLYMKKGFIKTGDIPRELKLKDGSYLDGENMVLFLK